jgi:ubiquitin-conjugating enzyme E2 Z|tara:strand:+ start:75 stop:794 length:720 start_codon:yes stop_codon:yes gene_type:complete
MSNSITITRETLHRLLQDVKDIIKNPLESQGIYYSHDESNILKGYALIIGPIDTPYQYGFYFFKLEYPSDYPHRPPVVKYLTNDGTTRFHPNLYRNGKVCLSILNTWKGEQWSSCQTISSILLTIVSIMDNCPLSNEPGFTSKSSECLPYNNCIQYKNFEIAINGILNERYAPKEYKYFKEQVHTNFKNNKDSIIKLINHYANIKKYNGEFIVGIYNMIVKTNYPKLVKEIENFTLSIQ